MEDFQKLECDTIKWRKITSENLNLDYAVLMGRKTGDQLLGELEDCLQYFTGDLARVRQGEYAFVSLSLWVFGKWHPIPRQQVAYGDPGISYTFSGLTVPALPWPEPVETIRDKLYQITGHRFDFVLVNRYRSGSDHISEHRDNEAELDHSAPIASLSLGQTRTFVLRHKDNKKSGPGKRDIPTVKLELEHGSLLLMNPPTNTIWYHSLPVRKSADRVRINMTFRKYNMSLK